MVSSAIFYCFIGAPGVGKGTQAIRVCQKLNLKHISTGGILRDAIRQKTPLGIKVQSYTEKGLLVPDHLMVALMENVFLNLKTGAILDGFPRTVQQAQALDDLMKKQKLTLKRCFYFTAPKELLIERISGRRMAPQSGHVYHIRYSPPKREGICDDSGEKLIQRKDDQEDIVRERLKAYLREESTLVEYYRKKSLLVEISATGSPDEIYERLFQFL